MCRARILDVLPAGQRVQRTRLILLVSSVYPWPVPLRSSTLVLVHCSSNLCQGGSSRRYSISVRLLLPVSPVASVSISISLVRCTVNYGVRATKSSRLIELLLESRQYGARSSKRKKKKKEKGKEKILRIFMPFIFFPSNHPLEITLFFQSYVYDLFTSISKDFREFLSWWIYGENEKQSCLVNLWLYRRTNEFLFVFEIVSWSGYIIIGRSYIKWKE